MNLYEQTVERLRTYNIKLRKGLSQNFLVNDQVLNQIGDSLLIGKEDLILEIGAGLGILTGVLLKKAKHVIAVEVDRELHRVLSQELKGCDNLTLLQKDILKFEPENYFIEKNWKAVGNLPYHLSGSILRWVLNHREHLNECYFMLQKEVAERICAAPGSKIYGVLSLLCQYFTRPEILFIVSKDSFLPKPVVDSAFIRMIVKPREISSSLLFPSLVKHSFAQRRKTIYNNLKSWQVQSPEQWRKMLQGLNLDEKLRAEEVSLDSYIKMADVLNGILNTTSRRV